MVEKTENSEKGEKIKELERALPKFKITGNVQLQNLSGQPLSEPSYLAIVKLGVSVSDNKPYTYVNVEVPITREQYLLYEKAMHSNLLGEPYALHLESGLEVKIESVCIN